jgi:retron-type reverse transcriptase
MENQSDSLESTTKNDLPIFIKWMDFVKWLLIVTDGFPKTTRFTFSDRLINLSLNVVEDLVEARYSRNRTPLLRRANLNLEKIRVLLRICFEQRLISKKTFAYGATRIHEVGKMLGGMDETPGRQFMRRHDGLFDQIVSFENLLRAAQMAMRGKREKTSVSSFYFHLENEILAIQSELLAGRYRPAPYRQFEIREPKIRKICSSEFRDRVVHHAICNIIEPVFERRSIFDSYACRKGKGSHSAVIKCQRFTRKFEFYLKCDIRKFFESVDHEVLKTLFRRLFKESRLLALLGIIVDHSVPGNEPGKGIPIGNLTSQHFANFYLGFLDHYVKNRLRVHGYVRYMDDFLLFFNDKSELHRLQARIEEFFARELKLSLKSRATIIAPVSQGVPFLGLRVFRNLIRIKRENLVRLRRHVRRKEQDFINGKISQKELILSINSVLGHLAHVNSLHERRRIFSGSLKLA